MSEATRNIVITGAAGGLGSALALACAGRGCQVLLIDKDLRGLEGVCDQIESRQWLPPGYCQLDLATAGPDAFTELVHGFVDNYGELDGLVHCAAAFDGLSPMDQVSGDAWLQQVQVNLNAAWLLTVTCLPSLRTAHGGNVVFVLEDEDRLTSAFWGAYGASKAAVRSLAAILAEELEGSNCRIFGVNPGPMRTALRASAYMAEKPESQPSPQRASDHIADLLMGQGGDLPALHEVPGT